MFSSLTFWGSKILIPLLENTVLRYIYFYRPCEFCVSSLLVEWITLGSIRSRFARSHVTITRRIHVHVKITVIDKYGTQYNYELNKDVQKKKKELKIITGKNRDPNSIFFLQNIAWILHNFTRWQFVTLRNKTSDLFLYIITRHYLYNSWASYYRVTRFFTYIQDVMLS